MDEYFKGQISKKEVIRFLNDFNDDKRAFFEFLKGYRSTSEGNKKLMDLIRTRLESNEYNKNIKFLTFENLYFFIRKSAIDPDLQYLFVIELIKQKQMQYIPFLFNYAKSLKLIKFLEKYGNITDTNLISLLGFSINTLNIPMFDFLIDEVKINNVDKTNIIKSVLHNIGFNQTKEYMEYNKEKINYILDNLFKYFKFNSKDVYVDLLIDYRSNKYVSDYMIENSYDYLNMDMDLDTLKTILQEGKYVLEDLTSIIAKVVENIMPYNLLLELIKKKGKITDNQIIIDSDKNIKKSLYEFIQDLHGKLKYPQIDWESIMKEIYNQQKDKIIGHPLSEKVLMDQLKFCLKNSGDFDLEICLQDILNFISKGIKNKKVDDILDSNLSYKDKILRIAALKLSNE